MHRFLEIVAQSGEPLALIGLAAVMLCLILKWILSLKVFAKMSERRTYGVIKLIISRTVAVALALILVGFLATLVPAFVPPSARLTQAVGSAPKDGIEIHERMTQVFSRQVGNGGSCVEDNVSTLFDLCLQPGCAVTSWEEIPLSGQNYSFSVDRHESMLNCVGLTLRYSDYGHDTRGACKGHGYINMKVRLNGRCVADPEREQLGVNSE